MRLSIVTITFNAEASIEKTIKSVLCQTVPVYEYIFIDGGSKDKTNEIINSYKPQIESKGTRVIHISEPDKGISDAFNKGIERATGDLIGIINSDDELLPNTSTILSDEWEKEKGDIFYGNCIWVDEERKREYISKVQGKPSQLMYYMTLIHPATFISKKAYEDVGHYKTEYKYCMDQELLYRMYRNGCTFIYIDKALTKFKSGGVSDKNARIVYREASNIPKQYGEPTLKILLIENKKLIRNRIVKVIKTTPFYLRLKKWHDSKGIVK